MNRPPSPGADACPVHAFAARFAPPRPGRRAPRDRNHMHNFPHTGVSRP